MTCMVCGTERHVHREAGVHLHRVVGRHIYTRIHLPTIPGALSALVMPVFPKEKRLSGQRLPAFLYSRFTVGQ